MHTLRKRACFVGGIGKKTAVIFAGGGDDWEVPGRARLIGHDVGCMYNCLACSTKQLGQSGWEAGARMHMPGTTQNRKLTEVSSARRSIIALDAARVVFLTNKCTCPEPKGKGQEGMGHSVTDPRRMAAWKPRYGEGR